jgi:transcriptional regulator with XRE-family HTH domain
MFCLPDQRMPRVDIASRFGENLTVYRKRANLSQEELGFLAALHRTEIGQLERGARLARVDTLVKLAGALAIPPGSLLKGMAWAPGGTTSGEFEISED